MSLVLFLFYTEAGESQEVCKPANLGSAVDKTRSLPQIRQKVRTSWVMMSHAFNPSTEEAEAGRSL